MTLDPRLRAEVRAAAPRLAFAFCQLQGEGQGAAKDVHERNVRRLEGEIRHLQNRAGYLVTRRALDAAVHSPQALKHAIASAAPLFARGLALGHAKEKRDAATVFVEALLKEGLRGAAQHQLRRLPLSEAVRGAVAEAFPRAVLAAAHGSHRQGVNVAAHLAADLVDAHAHRLRAPDGTLLGDLRNAALESAPTAAFAAVRRGEADVQRAVVEFVGRAGVVSVDHLANRFVRENAEDLFSARPRALALVKNLVLREWLMNREFVLPAARSVPGLIQAAQIPQPGFAAAAAGIATLPVWRQAWTHVVHVTPRAAAHFQVPLPPDLRRAFIPHYLATMDACLKLEQQLDTRGYQVLDMVGENQLIRESFAGRVFKAGHVVPKFPDAQLTVRAPGGAVEVLNVEYVTRSYTPEMIRAKARAFRGPTVWAADCPATAAKISAAAGSDAVVIL